MFAASHISQKRLTLNLLCLIVNKKLDDSNMQVAVTSALLLIKQKQVRLSRIRKLSNKKDAAAWS